MAVLVKLIAYVLVLVVGMGIGFGILSLLEASGPAGPPVGASQTGAGSEAPAPSGAGTAQRPDDQTGGAARTPAAAADQESSIFQTFATRFAGWFVSVACAKNRKMENGVAFGEDYLIHYVNGTMARYVTGGYHHTSADTIEFAMDDDNSELYTIDHETILLSGIKINKVVIQQPSVDPTTQSSLKMTPCAPWTRGKPEPEVQPTPPYSDTDGLRLAIQVGDGDAAIGFLSHGASLSPRELESLLTNSTVPEATKVNIKEQNRSNAGAAVPVPGGK
jgi:hypothetical protein